MSRDPKRNAVAKMLHERLQKHDGDFYAAYDRGDKDAAQAADRRRQGVSALLYDPVASIGDALRIFEKEIH